MKRFLVLIGIVALLSACAPPHATVIWSEDGRRVDITTNKSNIHVKVKDEKGREAEMDDKKKSLLEDIIKLKALDMINN